MLFAYYAAYDAAPDPTPAYWFVGMLVGLPVLLIVYQFVEPVLLALWSRYGEAVKRLANTEVPIPPVVFEVCGCVARVVARVASAVRYCLNPAAEKRRRLGRWLASLPPKSGLTRYEEIEAEINALPPGAARLNLRHQLRLMRKPSPAAIEAARRSAGRPSVPPALVRCLLRGEKPLYYKIDV